MAKSKLSTRSFEVPQDAFADFFTCVERQGLQMELMELIDSGTIGLVITYDQDDSEAVMTLMEIIDKY